VIDEELDRKYDAVPGSAALKEHEDLIMRSIVKSINDDLVSQDWFTGPLVTDGHVSSASSWCDKTPADILADVDALLATIGMVPAPMPALMQMPYTTYHWLANLDRRDRVKHLLTHRRILRPERFTAK